MNADYQLACIFEAEQHMFPKRGKIERALELFYGAL